MTPNVRIIPDSDQAVLGLNVFAAIVDEANFNPRGRVLLKGTPVRHRDLPDVVGVICSSFYDKSVWYVIDWLKEGFAPQAKSTWIRELPSEMHLLASV